MAITMAGFVGFEISWRADVYNGAVQASSAAEFGTQGIVFRARKPRDEQEWAAALAALSCSVPASLPIEENLTVWPPPAQPDRVHTSIEGVLR